MMTALNILYSFFISFKAQAGFKQAKAKACRLINSQFINDNSTAKTALLNCLKLSAEPYSTAKKPLLNKVDEPFKSSDCGGLNLFLFFFLKTSSIITLLI